jgi:hypothetical protein
MESKVKENVTVRMAWRTRYEARQISKTLGESDTISEGVRIAIHKTYKDLKKIKQEPS